MCKFSLFYVHSHYWRLRRGSEKADDSSAAGEGLCSLLLLRNREDRVVEDDTGGEVIERSKTALLLCTSWSFRVHMVSGHGSPEQ